MNLPTGSHQARCRGSHEMSVKSVPEKGLICPIRRDVRDVSLIGRKGDQGGGTYAGHINVMGFDPTEVNATAFLRSVPERRQNYGGQHF